MNGVKGIGKFSLCITKEGGCAVGVVWGWGSRIQVKMYI